MPNNETTTKFKADISQLKASMQEAARQVRLANSEFKAATAGMENWAKSTDGLNAKVKQLNSVLNAQKAQLSSLEKQYALVAKEQGEDSKGAQELAIKINYQKAAIGNTQAALSKYEAELANAGKGTKELDDELKAVGNDSSKASDGFTVMKGALSSLVADGVRVALNGVKQLGAAFINVGKQAIASYAEFEQLEGGVEKIFGKNAAKTVKKNADDAFKSAGMSANEYMSTVTSFSASLIKGLGGDTKAAAKYADVAIKDMSDNANSFGTDMESIQNAYKGFAKQNFSMLDNLNLGYGGSAQGMVELVKDSGILGKAADDLTNKNIKEKVSFDQMIQAIHITQQRLKIAGTTSKEAAGTLEGSTNAMKAAWQNLLTGIADDNADFKTLIDNFSKSLQTMLSNMLPRIKIAIQGIGQLVSQLLPELVSMVVAELPGLVSTLLPSIISTVQTLIQGLVTALPSLLTILSNSLPGILTNALNLAPQLLSVLTGAITQVLTTLSGMLPTLLQQFTAILPQLFSQLSAAIPQILAQITAMLPVLINGIVGALPVIIQGISQLIVGIVQALPQILTTLIDALPGIITTVVNTIVESADILVQALIQVIQILVPQLPTIINQLIEALVTLAPILLDGALQLFMGIVQALPQILPPLIQAIPTIIEGVINTLLTAIPTLLDAAVEFFMAIVDALPEIIDILIPMIPEITVKVIAALLKSLPQLIKAALTLFMGIHKAMLKAIASIIKALPAIGKSIIDGLGKALSKVADIGSDLVKGLWNGIKDMTGWIKDKIEGFGSDIVDGLKDFFGIHSPSTLMRDQVGVYLAEGVVAGVVKAENKSIKVLKASAARMTKGYMDGFVSSLSYASSRVTNTAKGLISNALGTMLSGGFNFSETANKASKNFSDSLAKQVEYLTNRMSYENEQKLAAFDSTISNYEKMRDSKVKVAEKSRDREIKRLESERDDAIKRIEKDRDKRLKELESKLNSNVDSKTKSLQKKRDARVDTLEKERDAKVEALEKKRDKEKDKKKKKKLTDEIKEIKKSYTEKIKTAKKGAEEEIDNLKSSDKKKNELIKQEISQVKENSAKEVNATKNSYDKQIKSTKNNTTKLVNNIKKQYEKLINSQKTAKNNYSSASSKMLTEFTNALNEYRTQAEDIVNTTIDGITDTYQAKYDALIDKQDDLIDKLISAGDLFEVSGAGVMTINDISMQVQGMKDYADKLQQIKSKVSKELFDEISKMDMKEGSAYIDRLLAYSEDELQTYNDLYTEKLDVAKELSKNLYQSDFDEVASEYTDAIEKAFDGLPAELEALGKESLSGFISGLTEGTDYMTGAIKQMIGSMISTFKTQLGIHSPSKVLMQLGEFTGEGFAEGLKKTIGLVTDSATSLVDVTATSLDGIKSTLNSAKSSVTSGASSNSVVTNNYNLVQNNNSPKPLTALQTYQARRQQIAMVKAFTS